jgi:hypothetical protein
MCLCVMGGIPVVMMVGRRRGRMGAYRGILVEGR